MSASVISVIHTGCNAAGCLEISWWPYGCEWAQGRDAWTEHLVPISWRQRDSRASAWLGRARLMWMRSVCPTEWATSSRRPSMNKNKMFLPIFPPNTIPWWICAGLQLLFTFWIKMASHFCYVSFREVTSLITCDSLNSLRFEWNQKKNLHFRRKNFRETTFLSPNAGC